MAQPTPTYDPPVTTGFDAMPYSLEAEQSVLGAILVDSACMSDVMEYLGVECFFRRQHQALFSLLLRMYSASSPIDFVTVLDRAVIEEVFASEREAKIYLAGLGEIVPSVANVKAYARIVQEKYYLRRLMEVAGGIIAETSGGTADAGELLESAEQQIYEIRQGRDTRGMMGISSLIVSAYDHLQNLSGPNREDYLGVKSGFSHLDNMLTGLNKSDLIFVAARPGMGKTSFVLNIAENVALDRKKTVAIFSLEMSGEQLVTRMLSSRASISSYTLRNGILSDDEWGRLAREAGLLSKANIFIDDSSGITVAGMKAKLRRIPDLGLVIIDYLQLMTSGLKRSDNRVQEVSEMTRGLKIMAKELNVPVICCAQLSRASEKRPNHRPVLSDLRESGSIEQDADSVLFLYRDEEGDDESRTVECIVGKNRHGETGSVELNWDGQYTRFSNVEYRRDAR